MFHADEKTDMTKLIVAVRNFAKASLCNIVIIYAKINIDALKENENLRET